LRIHYCYASKIHKKMILGTAASHFNDDLSRARGLYTLSLAQPNGTLKGDLKRSSWMFAVGALDAFFCDAYGDLLARVLRAKQVEPPIDLPERIKSVKIPAISVIRNNPSDGWRWRMVARDVIELDNVLSIQKIQNLLNQFCRDDRKIIKANSQNFENWILHRESKYRMFGVTKTEFRRSVGSDRNFHKKNAVKKINQRFKMIFQRRHDCIHNCDRPKVAIQLSQISDSFVKDVIYDMDFLVNRVLDDMRSEFPEYLSGLGFNAVTRNRVCQ